MPRKSKPLTALAVRSATVGRHYDGDGLELVVRSEAVALWSFRYLFAGRRREMGLGRARGLGAVSLAAARERVQELRRQVREGTDPLGERQAAKVALRRQDEASRVTVRQAAEDYVTEHAPGWKRPLHATQWRSSLRRHLYPTLGDRIIGGITMSDVADCLRPIWTEKPETANRVRNRLELVFSYAKAKGWATGDNPAAWRDGGLRHILPPVSKVRRTKHHPALPYRDLPAFMKMLATRDGKAAPALRFLILTAARSIEVRGATWSEIDMEGKAWIIPAKRMKMGLEHRVPLCTQALDLLRTIAPGGHMEPAAFVFPGAELGRPLSNMAFNMALRKMGRPDIVPHGFRSTFRDWAAEVAHAEREIAEAALAHTIASKVEAAYRRGDLFERRRSLMAAWGSYAVPNTPACGPALPGANPSSLTTSD